MTEADDKKAKKRNLRKCDEDFDLDKIIDEESENIGLLPTNLERGSLVEDSISTGSLAFDLVTGGGWPKGRRSNIFGKEQVGKSTALYYAIKSCIDQGIPTILYDFEGATDGDRVERIGVKTNWMKELKAKEPVLFRYYDKMTCGEQMFRHARRILDRMPPSSEGKVQLAFFHDSLPATPSEAKLQDDEKDPQATMARMYSQWLPTIKSAVAAKSAIWIDVNQLRTKPGTVYGNPEYEMCGDAVRTLSDVRVKAKKTIPTGGRGKPENKTYIETEECWNGIGVDRYNFAEFYVIKNKAFSPNRGCTLRIWFEEAGQPGRGIDPLYDCYEFLRLTGQIHYNRRKFTILMDPFDKLREVKLPDIDEKGNQRTDPETGAPLFKMVPDLDDHGKEKVDQKTGVVTMRYATEKRSDWTWAEMKDLVLNPANTKGKDRKAWDIVAVCRKQIQDGTAFKLYFDNLVNTSQGDEE